MPTGPLGTDAMEPTRWSRRAGATARWLWLRTLIGAARVVVRSRRTIDLLAKLSELGWLAWCATLFDACSEREMEEECCAARSHGPTCSPPLWVVEDEARRTPRTWVEVVSRTIVS